MDRIKTNWNDTFDWSLEVSLVFLTWSKSYCSMLFISDVSVNFVCYIYRPEPLLLTYLFILNFKCVVNFDWCNSSIISHDVEHVTLFGMLNFAWKNAYFTTCFNVWLQNSNENICKKRTVCIFDIYFVGNKVENINNDKVFYI